MTHSVSARARLMLDEPASLLAALAEHMSEHGAKRESHPEALTLTLDDKKADFRWSAGGPVIIQLTAANDEQLYYLREMAVHHLIEFGAPQAAALSWEVDGEGFKHPPNFRLLTVVANGLITPHMRRLTLSGDVARYDTLKAIHVKIMLQPDGKPATEQPTVGESGLIEWPDPDNRPLARKYTLRRVDVATGQVDIDFVVHEDAGPGSRFAEMAVPGDVVGVFGAGGGGLVDKPRYLFAGDETALPAMARMLDALPESASGHAFIEVNDAAERQVLTTRADIAVTWLERGGAAPGSTSLLVDAIKATPIVADGDTYVWVGCEFQAFKEIRDYLRHTYDLPKGSHLVVGYWRLGQSDD